MKEVKVDYCGAVANVVKKRRICGDLRVTLE